MANNTINIANIKNTNNRRNTITYGIELRGSKEKSR